MAERVDLDAIETRLATRYGEAVTMKVDDVLALVAETRELRETVELLRHAARSMARAIEILQEDIG
jgi:urocanate hydratase